MNIGVIGAGISGLTLLIILIDNSVIFLLQLRVLNHRPVQAYAPEPLPMGTLERLIAVAQSPAGSQKIEPVESRPQRGLTINVRSIFLLFAI